VSHPKTITTLDLRGDEKKMAKIYIALATMAFLMLIAVGPAIAGTFPPYPPGHCGAGNCYGTSEDDTMIGTSADEGLHGLGGDDAIYGMGGNDGLTGDDGNDALYGGLGNDIIEGNKGWDLLKGGRGTDDLHGGYGSDVLRGGGGLDEFTCGGGSDIVYASAKERNEGHIADDCEVVILVAR
jgi:Ca2+-binding RTX toxin-like protein